MGACFSSSSSKSRRRERDLYGNYYPSRLDYVSPIYSHQNYARELLREEPLPSSSLASSVDINHHPQAHNDLHTLVQYQEQKIKTENEIKLQELDQENEPGESSKRYCSICLEDKPSSEFFGGAITCPHLYCTECTIRHVETKIGENVGRIKCPGVNCTQELEPYMCRDMITKGMLERWDKNFCESLVLSWDRLYCPFQGCSAVMVVDGDDGENARVFETECMTCHRLFCAQCKVPWHAGIGCEEFQRGENPKKNSDDVVIEMAKSENWRRCPNCKFFVGKNGGCLHISCRCGCKFCYGCGVTFGYLRPTFLHACPRPETAKI